MTQCLNTDTTQTASNQQPAFAFVINYNKNIMVSKASRWKKLQRLTWQKSDGQGAFPANFENDAEAIKYERCHSPTKHLSGQRQQLEWSRDSPTKMTNRSCDTAVDSFSKPDESSQSELMYGTDGLDVESLSDILEGPYMRETEQSQSEKFCDKSKSVLEEFVDKSTPSLNLKYSDDERESLDWISDEVENERRIPDSEELHEGNIAAIHDNHPSLKKRFKRFLDVHRVSMSIRRRDVLEAGGSRLLQLGKAAGSEVHRYGDATVVIHCETRDALPEGGPSISRIQRKSKFQGWKDSIKRNLRNVTSAASRSKQLSDTESFSSNEVRLFIVCNVLILWNGVF
jgi:hypothetical protein